MTLALKGSSKWWYARPMVNGRREFVKLPVVVDGLRPRSLRELGDEVFEHSRRAAQEALRDWLAVHKAGDAEYHRKMYELLTRRKLVRPQIELARIMELWTAAPRRRERSPRYLERAGVQIKAFVTWAGARGATFLRDVTPDMAVQYGAHLQGKKLTAATVNSHMILLRSVFKRLAPEAGLADNPFSVVQLRAENTVHRQPFTAAELALVLEKLDPDLRGAAITAACTAMRREDACRLQWASVDLEAGFISTRTAKTGEPIDVPIFDTLRTALVEAKGTAAVGESFVWPRAALLVKSRPDLVSAKMVEAVTAAGCAPNVPRESGQRAANVRGWHSLRTTWITTALAAGVPIELVRRVTGHTAVAVVLKHYFRPARDEFRKRLVKAFPHFRGASSPLAAARPGSDAPSRRARPSASGPGRTSRSPSAGT